MATEKIQSLNFPYLSHRYVSGNLSLADMDFGIDENGYTYTKSPSTKKWIPTALTAQYYEPNKPLEEKHDDSLYPINTIKFYPKGALLNLSSDYPGKAEVVELYPKFYDNDYTNELRVPGYIDISNATPYGISLEGTQPALSYGQYGYYSPKKKQSEYKLGDVVLLSDGTKMTYDEYYKKYKNDMSHIMGTVNRIDPSETLQNADGTTTSYNGGMAKIRRDIQIEKDKQDVDQFWGGFTGATTAIALAPIVAPTISATASSPAGVALAKGLLASEIGGRAVDLGMSTSTGKDWRQNLNQLFGVDDNSITGTYITPLTNPGYLAGGLVDRGLTFASNAIENGVSKLTLSASSAISPAYSPSLLFMRTDVVPAPYSALTRAWRTVAAPLYVAGNYYKVAGSLNGEQMPKGFWKDSNFWNDVITGRISQRFSTLGSLLYPITDSEKAEVLNNLNEAAKAYNDVVVRSLSPLSYEAVMPTRHALGSYNSINEKGVIYVRQGRGSNAINPWLSAKRYATHVGQHEGEHANLNAMLRAIGVDSYDDLINKVNRLEASIWDKWYEKNPYPTHPAVAMAEEADVKEGVMKQIKTEVQDRLMVMRKSDPVYKLNILDIDNMAESDIADIRANKRLSKKQKEFKINEVNSARANLKKLATSEYNKKYYKKALQEVLQTNSYEDRINSAILDVLEKRRDSASAKYNKALRKYSEAKKDFKEENPYLQGTKFSTADAEEAAIEAENLTLDKYKETVRDRFKSLNYFFPDRVSAIPTLGVPGKEWKTLPEAHSFFNTPRWWTIGALGTLGTGVGSTYYMSPWFLSLDNTKKAQNESSPTNSTELRKKEEPTPQLSTKPLQKSSYEEATGSTADSLLNLLL